jgi:hypothetical protein
VSNCCIIDQHSSLRDESSHHKRLGRGAVIQTSLDVTPFCEGHRSYKKPSPPRKIVARDMPTCSACDTKFPEGHRCPKATVCACDKEVHLGTGGAKLCHYKCPHCSSVKPTGADCECESNRQTATDAPGYKPLD